MLQKHFGGHLSKYEAPSITFDKDFIIERGTPHAYVVREYGANSVTIDCGIHEDGLDYFFKLIFNSNGMEKWVLISERCDHARAVWCYFYRRIQVDNCPSRPEGSNNGPSVQMTRDVRQSEKNHRAGSSAPQP